MDFKIVPFEEKWIDEMAELVVDSYQKPGYEWNFPTARIYLKNYLSPEFSKYCFAAVGADNQCLGAIFCSYTPYLKGNYLYVSEVQVKPKFRKQGIVKALMQKVIETAKENGCVGSHILVDGTKFTPEFYKSLGCELTGWVEIEMHFRT